jgi:hypothetical protein
MPLFADDRKLSAKTLAPLLPRDGVRRKVTLKEWVEWPEAMRQPWIDMAEAILDDLRAMGILK